MNWTKLSIASLIGGVVYFFTGWAVHGVALKEMVALPDSVRSIMEIPESEFKFSFMVISCILCGVILTLILLRWAGVSTFSGGAKIGAIIAVLTTFWYHLSLASMYHWFSLSQIGISAVGEAICMGLAGGAIGWYLGRD